MTIGRRTIPALTLALSTLALGAAAAEPPRWAIGLEDLLPIVARVAPELNERTPEDLRAYRRALLARLHLGDGRGAVETPRDLHDAVLLAAVGARLLETPDDSPAARLAAARSAYTVHLAGVAVEESPRLRAAVEHLPETSDDPATKALFRDLARSADGLRELGRRWFPHALHRALPDDVDDDELHQLRGLWLAREDRLDEAIEALRQAITARATLPRSLDLLRLLARDERLDEARHLARSVAKQAPGAAGMVKAVFREQADRVATGAFEAANARPTTEERIAQLHRYARLERPEAAGALAESLLRDAPDDLRILGAVAELWIRQGRLSRLDRLLERAGADGELPVRLREARVAAAVMTRLASARSAAIPEASGDLEGDLARLADERGEPARRLAEELRPVLAAIGDGDAGLKRRAEEALEGDEVTVRRLRVVAAALLASGDADGAMEALRRAQPRVRTGERAAAGLLLGGLEVVYGANRGERGLLARGLARLRRLGALRDPGAEALRTHHLTTGGLVADWLAGREGDSKGAMEALLPLLETLDRSTVTGATAARAVALSVGGLALAAGERELGVGALQVARRVGPRDTSSLLAAGQVALAVEDPGGALTWLRDAVEQAPTPEFRFLAHKWRSLAANRSRRPEALAEHVEAMDSLWDSVGAPPAKATHRPWPAMAGQVELAVDLEPGEPLGLRVEVLPLVALIADFPHDRQHLKQLGVDP